MVSRLVRAPLVPLAAVEMSFGAHRHLVSHEMHFDHFDVDVLGDGRDSRVTMTVLRWSSQLSAHA